MAVNGRATLFGLGDPRIGYHSANLQPGSVDRRRFTENERVVGTPYPETSGRVGYHDTKTTWRACGFWEEAPFAAAPAW
jgi:hypothetical protein